MLAVTGYNSRIVQELIPLLPEGENIHHLVEDLHPTFPVYGLAGCNRYLLCAGLLQPKKTRDQEWKEIHESLDVNLIRPMDLCEEILRTNDHARICVVGSESGFMWSHDGTYAAAKAALHRYVETKKLKPGQQLVCVAPSIIGDTNMTMAREDVENLKRRRAEHPKRRFLKAVEVASVIHFLLYRDEGYLSGQVIRMNGGC
jgi:NAD(P)-dependent dehydrogenase (short-subunit alcohol dehydrogenase family)